jgi:PAS domain S-box-containing protein
MDPGDRVNILLVDDQPAKLMSYEVILQDLGENLLKATSGREALEHLLKSEVAIVLVDVCMPDLDGFQLAAMIRDHPRFQKTAIIFISAIHLSDMDRLRGYEMGAVDYVPVPVIPEVLRAKVKVFAELYRKTRQLERLNAELEDRVALRTAELEASTAQLTESEQRRSLALVAGNMGSWDWDRINGDCLWDAGQCRIFGVDPECFAVTPENIKALIHPEDWPKLHQSIEQLLFERKEQQIEFRIRRPTGEVRWCLATAAPSTDAAGNVVRLSGVTVDITERKQSEVRQVLLAREVDHRAKNALAIVQSIVRLTRAESIAEYMAAVEGRITALSRAHTVLSHSRWQGADLTGLVEEELAPYRSDRGDRIETAGPAVSLQPASAQTFTLALHELATNAVKYGALSSMSGRLRVSWEMTPTTLVLRWDETDGPPARKPTKLGFGTRIIMASVEGQLGGKATFSWHESGLHCKLTIPRSDKVEQPDAGPIATTTEDKSPPAAQKFVVKGNQVMVVEDEALVAMVVSDALTDLGYQVAGPFSRPDEAIAAVKEGGISAAILDINLAGALVYPVADELLARGIPFVFVTGYGTESIERRFADIPVLQKPIERDALQRIFINGRAGQMNGSPVSGSTAGEGGATAPRTVGDRRGDRQGGLGVSENVS